MKAARCTRVQSSRCWLAPVLALSLAAPVAPAAAADAPLWELGLGVAALRLSHYRGAERAKAWLLPAPYAVYRGEILKADRNGLKALLLDSDRVDFDISLAATAPTRSADEPVRAGMPDLPGTLEFGPNLNLRLAQGPGWKMEARLPVRAAWTLQAQPRFIGLASSPHVNVDHRLGRWNLGVQAGLLFGSRRQHAFFYDVAPEWATASRPAYRASAGLAGWQATVGLSRRDGNRWFGAFVRADSLAGSSLRDSPLVRRTQTFNAGVAMSWVLWQSERRVPDRDDEFR